MTHCLPTDTNVRPPSYVTHRMDGEYKYSLQRESICQLKLEHSKPCLENSSLCKWVLFHITLFLKKKTLKITIETNIAKKKKRSCGQVAAFSCKDALKYKLTKQG